ncbi:Phosphatidyl-N-methylethanolamine N-methyltransferase [Coemansia thaxteri]|uniref:Phosphatidyl-N-methylethanolamine N-methyltransferase n=1 Tax=Coemansia thaxteri TaxID=2663907 RepID=A0A9W8BJW1_9FUNG|nr:Phosphatidyl-N-methylethanolamine N-methyltransferase [Coemansia thaxteri]KAJ2009026.1 Phosphatidyl-N-methylethanolamine N-methyltransferase [Coemansia thaxteri]KAJ2468894.1 Phosphatidyl-N-methylethanolamine N-methyltransferase [Coemansia sp. RSA 2320]KAJ2473663.1 Phosphatidyl-N-methylethanolamine N-methyltransferase [Coemansia sp. RSA 2322]
MLVDFSQVSLWLALASITFNPTAWNIAARQEHHTRWLTQLCGGARQGCYAIAAAIFSLGIVRDLLYSRALAAQPTASVLDNLAVRAVGACLFMSGMGFVASSTYALGITGTFLGDYFGILMDKRVTGFPFNVLDNPMYVGSAMSFLGTALWNASPAGLMITAYVWLVYSVALRFEGPFTAQIYAARASTVEAKQKPKAVNRKKKI